MTTPVSQVDPSQTSSEVARSEDAEAIPAMVPVRSLPPGQETVVGPVAVHYHPIIVSDATGQGLPGMLLSSPSPHDLPAYCKSSIGKASRALDNCKEAQGRSRPQCLHAKHMIVLARQT